MSNKELQDPSGSNNLVKEIPLGIDRRSMLTGIAGAVGAIGIAACSGKLSSAPEETPTPTLTPEETPTPTLTPEEIAAQEAERLKAEEEARIQELQEKITECKDNEQLFTLYLGGEEKIAEIVNDLSGALDTSSPEKCALSILNYINKFLEHTMKPEVGLFKDRYKVLKEQSGQKQRPGMFNTVVQFEDDLITAIKEKLLIPSGLDINSNGFLKYFREMMWCQALRQQEEYTDSKGAKRKKYSYDPDGIILDAPEVSVVDENSPLKSKTEGDSTVYEIEVNTKNNFDDSLPFSGPELSSNYEDINWVHEINMGPSTLFVKVTANPEVTVLSVNWSANA